jgi:hypothetical protein
MLHPSEQAAEYITQRLLETHFDANDDALRASIGSLRAARRHRHQRPRGAAASTFASQQLARCHALTEAHPHLLDCGLLDEERAHFEAMVREAEPGGAVLTDT